MRGASALLGFVIAASLGSCTTPAEPPRSLVLISLDTVAPRRMSLYGATRETTPTIDRIARSSTVFTNAFSTAPWTLPAHASMLSGLYPTSLSQDPNDRRLYKLAPLVSTLFREHGYTTAAITENGFVSKKLGADTGFDWYREAIKGNAAWQALEWLSSAPRQPFFLFVQTYSAHVPYRDRRYVEGLQGERIRKLYTPGSGLLHWQVCCGGMELSQSEIEFLLALYDGGVSAADDVVRKVVSRLEELDLLDRTTIVITSDHGEEFFEHTQRGAYHGHSLYNDVLRVPLIWHEPGSLLRNGKVDEPVSLVDIVPTIINRFGLSDETTRDGADLTPLLESGEWGLTRPLFAEGTLHGPRRYSVWTDRGKAIYTPEPYVQHEGGKKWPVPVRASRELYLAADVNEQNNIAEDPTYESLRDELFAVLQQHIDSAQIAGVLVEDPVVDGALDERLRELGYLE